MATEYRVYGPPGCGKTTYIASQAKEYCEQFGGDQVSICSLTNTAVREAVGRDLPVDPGNVSTLHARCKRSLNAPGPAESRVGEFIKEFPDFATDECLPPGLLRRRNTEGEPETTDEVMVAGSREPTLYERVQILRQQMVPREEWNPQLSHWFGAWEEWMTGTGALDFTGWLEAALREGSLPAQQVVFVDEAQDHTPLQLAVIRGWQTRHRVLVGDDDQNLYEWSGAIPDRFFLPPLPENREKVLSQSYRVPRAVHAVAQRWVKQMQSRREKAYHPRDADGEVRVGGLSLNEIDMGSLPERLIERGNGSKMFLTSAGYMLDPLIDALKERRIPFHNPYRRGNTKWNPLASPSAAIEAFLLPHWSGAEAYAWLKVLRSRGVFQPGKRRKVLDFLKENPRRHLTLDDLAPALLPQTVLKVEREDLSIFKLRRATAAGEWDYAIDLYGRSREERQPEIIVGTIHSVKGGQADHVFLMPDLSPAAGGEYLGQRRDRVIRLMYVGMTRAACTLELGRQAARNAVVW